MKGIHERKIKDIEKLEIKKILSLWESHDNTMHLLWNLRGHLKGTFLAGKAISWYATYLCSGAWLGVFCTALSFAAMSLPLSLLSLRDSDPLMTAKADDSYTYRSQLFISVGSLFASLLHGSCSKSPQSSIYSHHTVNLMRLYICLSIKKWM